MNPNILITGGQGQLGTSLGKLLPHAIVTDKNELALSGRCHEYKNQILKEAHDMMELLKQ